MDGFNNPLPNTYLTLTRFIIPNEGGGIRGISVTKTEYQYLNAVYAFIIAEICGILWQLVVLLTLNYYPLEDAPRAQDEKHAQITGHEEALEIRKRETNRHITLIMMWNASNPLTAIPNLCAYVINACLGSENRDSIAGYWNIFILISAVLVFCGATAAGVFIPPTFLEAGAFAPVNPASVFYAAINISDLSQGPRIQQTVAPAIQRAMGIVEFAKDELSKKVHIVHEAGNQTGPSGEILGRITYDYNVTGVDLGLQHKNSVNFVLTVKGACTLEYSWFNTSMSDDTVDVYNVYGTTIYMTRIVDNKSTGGKVVLDNTGKVERNSSYAIIPETLGRASTSAGYDPWYTTVSGASPNTLVIDNQRPALSCWEENTWSYGRYTAKGIEDLGNLPGLNLPTIIGEDILQNRMAYPMIVDVASGLGNSILVSSTTGLVGIVDAATATYADDFSRLIFASYVATQSILRDTAMVTNKYDLQNGALGDSGTPKPGTGDFVLTSGEVQALSFDTLIAIPVIFFTFWLLKFFITRTLKSASHAAAFEPIQMYRFIDEQVCGYRDDWVESRLMGVLYIKKAGHVQPGDEQKPAADKQKPEIEEIAPQTPAANMHLPVYASPSWPSSENRPKFNGPLALARPEVTAAPETTDEKATGTIDEQEREFLVIFTP